MPRNPLNLAPSRGPEALPEEEIKALAATDKKKAFDRVVQTYRDRIYYHALRITKDSEEAFDVAQEVFVRAYHEERLFDADFRIKAWLYRVCTNRCYNLVRDRQRRGGILQRMGRQDEVLREQHKAIDVLLRKEESEGVAEAVGRLSADHRTILWLRYFDDLSYREIAEVLEVKLGTVMSRLSRAKLRLHEVLTEGTSV